MNEKTADARPGFPHERLVGCVQHDCEACRNAGWQPIETAPKDGTSVLLLIGDADHALHDDTYAVSIGSYGVEGGPEYDPTWNFAGWCWTHDHYTRGEGTPTHWMPLPLPPNA